MVLRFLAMELERCGAWACFKDVMRGLMKTWPFRVAIFVEGVFLVLLDNIYLTI